MAIIWLMENVEDVHSIWSMLPKQWHVDLDVGYLKFGMVINVYANMDFIMSMEYARQCVTIMKDMMGKNVSVLMDFI